MPALRSPQGEEGTIFMQNKPNFRKAKMNISPALTKDYENETAFSLRQNKPNFIRHSLVAFVAASAKKAGEGGFKGKKMLLHRQSARQPSCGNGCQDKICNTLIDLHRFGW